MRSPCDPPKFDEKDWSQFDFSRWHADGVSEEETDNAVADLAAKFFQSDEWSENFKSKLPEVKTAVRATYEAEIRTLRQDGKTTEQEFDVRIQAAEKRAESARAVSEGANGPVILAAQPDTFQLGVRLIEEKSKLGLPGTTVRMMDPREPKEVLHETTTDSQGNAIFSLTPEEAKEFDTIHAGLQIAGVSGKPIENLPAAVCVRLNGTETKVVAIKDTLEIADSKRAAAAAQAQRTEEQKHLHARVERLKVERAERLRDIDCRVKDVEALVRELREDGNEPPDDPDTMPTKRTAAARKKSEPKKE
jgi:hypothetical protein